MRAADLESALLFLLERQDDEGLWRDYALEPGSSEAWTTSYVGAAVAILAPRSRALQRARAAVAGRRRDDGWGYNSATACDADSTAWSLRFLQTQSGSALVRYIDVEG